MRYSLCLFMAFFCANLYCQKTTSNIIEAENLERIIFTSEEVFRIDISTTPGKTISIKTDSQGEYSNDIGIDHQIDQGTLYLTSKFREKLQDGYDKLSAHKVFAIKVDLIIPEGLIVQIRSNLASVYAEGSYKHLIIELKSGSASLQKFFGNTLINTYGGNIEIETKNARVEAFTRNGELDIPQFMHGDNLLKLTSIDGNITVRKTD